MNIQKFTQKSIEAINDCEKLAYEYSHQEIDIEHLMVALLSVDDSFIRKLIIKMGIDADAFLADCEGLLARRNKVTGNVELRISQGLNKILICSEDEAKLMGGIGVCGRPLCCATFLPDFNPVSIKMAKEQNLSLNPTKISGVCGRLMCCLKNEEETYEELNSHLPAVGDTVTTPEKLKGEVYSLNVLRQLVKVVVTLDNDEKEIREYPVSELRFKPRRRVDKSEFDAKELRELKELEDLERKEGKSQFGDD